MECSDIRNGGTVVDQIERALARLDRSVAMMNEKIRLLSCNYLQIEALFSIFSCLKIRYPLPPMRGWAVSPDFAKVLVSLILQFRPRLIVETGSGVSTLLCAYALQRNGSGRILSLEHDERFYASSLEQIRLHEMENIATVHLAPIQDIRISQQTWPWYSVDAIAGLETGSVDMLVIDGPPGKLHRCARYPALPILIEKLSPDVRLVIDDANRDDEARVAELWHAEFPDFRIELLPTEKGAFVMLRGNTELPCRAAGS
jgi:predicted O-methyltransferase YrrM